MKYQFFYIFYNIIIILGKIIGLNVLSETSENIIIDSPGPSLYQPDDPQYYDILSN